MWKEKESDRAKRIEAGEKEAANEPLPLPAIPYVRQDVCSGVKECILTSTIPVEMPSNHDQTRLPRTWVHGISP
jgi:hypothetical protein